MIFGPWLIFTPMKPIKLKKENFAKRVVVQAQKKSVRYVALFLFLILTAMQG
jgi:hypothetical protein